MNEYCQDNGDDDKNVDDDDDDDDDYGDVGDADNCDDDNDLDAQHRRMKTPRIGMNILIKVTKFIL